jgi:hypothetical protein
MPFKILTNGDRPSREYEVQEWTKRVKRRMWWRHWRASWGQGLLIVTQAGATAGCLASAWLFGAEDRLTLSLCGLALATLGLRRALCLDSRDGSAAWAIIILLLSAGMTLALYCLARTAIDHAAAG